MNLESAAERLCAVFGSCVGGERCRRQFAQRRVWTPPDLGDQLEAIDPRQSQVGDEDVGNSSAQDTECIGRGLSRRDLRAGRLENFADHPERVGIVVDGKHSNTQQVRYQQRASSRRNLAWIHG